MKRIVSIRVWKKWRRQGARRICAHPSALLPSLAAPAATRMFAKSNSNDSGVRAHRRYCTTWSRARATCAALGACALLTTNAHAEPPCDASGRSCPLPLNAESARGLALGTGSRASSVSTSALAYNPAALAIGRLYHIEGSVDYMPDQKTVALGGAVVDSSTSRVGAGLSLRGFVSGSGGLQGIDGRLGLAFPFSETVSLGVTGRYLNVSRQTPSATEMARSTRLVKGFTMDASLRIVPIPALMLEVASYNFINRDSVYAPVMVAGGAGFSISDIALIGADLLVDVTSYDSPDFTVGGGAEVFAGRTVPLRVGYSFDSKRVLHTLTFGLGYTDRTVGFDLSLRQQLGHGGDTRIMGAFRYYVH